MADTNTDTASDVQQQQQQLSDWNILSDREKQDAQDAVREMSSATQEFMRKSMEAWVELVNVYARAWQGLSTTTFQAVRQQTLNGMNHHSGN